MKGTKYKVKVQSLLMSLRGYTFSPPVAPHAPTCVVQRPQDPQLVHGVEHVVLGGRVHEVKEQQVLHAQRLEQQHHVGQVGPLDLRYGGGQHLVLIGTLRVQPVGQGERDRQLPTGYILDGGRGLVGWKRTGLCCPQL